ncbi:MAG: dTDP-4-dehydrorhamnose reductase [Micrococcales bacterium]|nr:dTDP-4-dehydrorhamnose reductase [Micrococcales bacterium]MCL2668617.1 dTDP-4-dehydrorhamnose reductase [Micrococcales bacterium]
MLGTDLVEVATAAGHVVRGVDQGEADITVPGSLDRELAGVDVVVNCAAWTAVDAAEDNEPAAFAANAVGAGLVARSAATAGARMVQISTDYVFDGHASAPYGEDDPVAPRTAYGRTKAAGEWAVRAYAPDHLVVRTAWLYGAHGPCFPRTITRLAAERGTVAVVDDQVGQPTWTVDLADLVVRLVDAGAPAGTYHGTSSGQVSWFGLARACAASAGLDPQAVTATTSEHFVRPAERPAYSVLGHRALGQAGVQPVGDWYDRWQVAAGAVLAG